MVRIKFKTTQDRINGLYALATKGRGRSLPNAIFEIADRYLKILDEARISYQVIPSEEALAGETEALRNSLTADV